MEQLEMRMHSSTTIDDVSALGHSRDSRDRQGLSILPFSLFKPFTFTFQLILDRDSRVLNRLLLHHQLDLETASFMASKYKTKFQDNWLANEKYRDWLVTDSNIFNARCKWCMKSFSVGGQGESALKSHMEGKKHLAFASAKSGIGSISSLFSSQQRGIKTTLPSTSHSQDDSAPNANIAQKSAHVQPSKPVSLCNYVTREDTLSAEVIWTLHSVNNHHSFLSNAGIDKTFRRMFPDSIIAKNFGLSERKSSYMTTFGLAPYISSLLDKKLSSDHFVLLFDESMNKQYQNKQMDYHVRIWDCNVVKTRYYSSRFMGHATTQDMIACFDETVGQLNLKHMLQISMDGPNVNWSFHEKIDQRVKESYGVNLLNAGSCGLHKMHGAFKSAIDATGWHLDSVLKGIYKLFSDTPARREDYTKSSGSSLFPLHFCNHRWLENAKVAQRVMDILPAVSSYVKSVPKSKTFPSAFGTVKEAVDDVFLPAKLAFFLSLARQVEPFLAEYQTDKPMMPFMYQDINGMAIKCLSRFIKEDVLSDLKKTSDFFSLDVTHSENHVTVHKIKIGFVAESLIQQLKSQKRVSDLQIIDFKDACKKSLICFMKKFLEKSPLRYQIVNHMACLDPEVVVDNKQGAMLKMKKILQILTNKRDFAVDDCDEVLEEFSEFLDSAISTGSLSSFSKGTDRLDEFYHGLLSPNKKHSKVWAVIRMLLLLSHGQASVERGFSVNKELEDSNMAEKTLVARRLTVDFVRSMGCVENIEINSQLLMSAGSAYNKYKLFLETQKEKKVVEQRGQKRKHVEGEIEELQKKRKILKRDITALSKSVDDYAMRAEKERKISHIIHSNSLKKRMKEKEDEEMAVEKLLDEKLLELKNSV